MGLPLDWPHVHRGEHTPTTFTLDGHFFNLSDLLREDETKLDHNKLQRGYAPLLQAWWRFVWKCACREVERRYCFDGNRQRPKGHVDFAANPGQQEPRVRMTVPDLYMRLHESHSGDDLVKQESEIKALYVALGASSSRKDHGDVFRHCGMPQIKDTWGRLVSAVDEGRHHVWKLADEMQINR